MSRRLPNRYRRPGHQRVGERARSDADMVRSDLRIPEHRGAAIGAEMKLDFSSGVVAAHVRFTRPLDVHLVLREMGADLEGGAGTPLALRAMIDGHDRRLTGHLHAQRPAAATSDPGHRKPFILALRPSNGSAENPSFEVCRRSAKLGGNRASGCGAK